MTTATYNPTIEDIKAACEGSRTFQEIRQKLQTPKAPFGGGYVTAFSGMWGDDERHAYRLVAAAIGITADFIEGGRIIVKGIAKLEGDRVGCIINELARDLQRRNGMPATDIYMVVEKEGYAIVRPA